MVISQLNNDNQKIAKPELCPWGFPLGSALGFLGVPLDLAGTGVGG